MAWTWFFRALYLLLRGLDEVVRRVWRTGTPAFTQLVDVRVRGRRTGRERRLMLTLLTVDGQSYIGHPNGPTDWTVNVEASGSLEIVDVRGDRQIVLAARVPPGLERDGVIRATWTQQPFPGDVIYTLARRHVTAVGVYFRLTPPLGRPGPGDPPAGGAV